LITAGVAKEFFFRFILHRLREQKKAVTVAVKSGQFTGSEAGKGQLLCGDRGNLGERIVREMVLE